MPCNFLGLHQPARWLFQAAGRPRILDSLFLATVRMNGRPTINAREAWCVHLTFYQRHVGDCGSLQKFDGDTLRRVALQSFRYHACDCFSSSARMTAIREVIKTTLSI